MLLEVCFLENFVRNFYGLDAVLRGVNVKIISAALHYPKIGLNFLKSLELLNEVSKMGSVEIVSYFLSYQKCKNATFSEDLQSSVTK